MDTAGDLRGRWEVEEEGGLKYACCERIRELFSFGGRAPRAQRTCKKDLPAWLRSRKSDSGKAYAYKTAAKNI